jgi:hypothetical protein
MTDRSKLLALADAVEKLTGPDRGMDTEIAACLRIGTEHPWALKYPEWIATANGRVHLEKNGPSFASPLYTASLDAAMTLVPEGRFVGAINQCDGYGEWYARIEAHDAVFQDAVAPIAALALTAACLRAQAEALA